MKFSFHGGHSSDYCCHAPGGLRATLEAYAANGFSHIAVTEHLPSREGFLYPGEEKLGAAFLKERFSHLFSDARPELHKAFDSRLQLFVGFETEFYGNDPCAELERAVEDYKPEIIVGSVHHVRNIPTDHSRERYEEAKQLCGGTLDSLWAAYYDAQEQLIKCLARYAKRIPVVLGHMDVIKLFSPNHEPGDDIWQRIERNIAAAIAAGIVVEVNARALKKGLPEPYPSKRILQEINRQKGEITFGDDSHMAADVGLNLPEAIAFARQIISEAVVFEKTSDGGYRKRKVRL